MKKHLFHIFLPSLVKLFQPPHLNPISQMSGVRILSMASQPFVDRLTDIGVVVNSDIQNYVDEVLKNQDSTGLPNWHSQIWSEKMMDDHLLMGGLSGLDFPTNTIIVTPHTCERIQELACSESRDISDEIADLTGRFRWFVGVSSATTVLLPICSRAHMHWGMVVVQNGTITWGDSLGFKPFGGTKWDVAQIVKLIMEAKYKVEFTIVYNTSGKHKNFILDTLHYEKQCDGYSCGFYVLSALSHFAKHIGDLPCFAYDSYDKNITERMRVACVRQFFRAVRTVYANMRHSTGSSANRQRARAPRVSDMDVMIHIARHHLRFHPPYPQMETVAEAQLQARLRPMRGQEDGEIRKIALESSSLEDIINRLRNGGEYYNKRSEHVISNREYIRRVKYSCFKYRSGCSACLNARYYQDENMWRVSKIGVHNHGIIVACPVICKPRRS